MARWAPPAIKKGHNSRNFVKKIYLAHIHLIHASVVHNV